VKFNGIPATSYSSWGPTQITAQVPPQATSGPVTVSFPSGLSSNALDLTIQPVISGVSPLIGRVGTSVTISGTSFGATQGSSTVSINGAVATPTAWSSTGVTVAVPNAATNGNITVTTAGGTSNGVSFTVIPAPVIASLSPASGRLGGVITIAGSNFGIGQQLSTVSFNGTVGYPTSWSDSTIVVPVPTGATTGPVIVNAAGFQSNAWTFEINPSPSITLINPDSGITAAVVSIQGDAFGASQSDSKVNFGTKLAQVVQWSEHQIDVRVPGNFFGGMVTITVAGSRSNGVYFDVPLRCVSNCQGERTTLSVTPDNLAILVGEESELNAIDNLGEEVGGVVWTVDNSGLGEIALQNGVATFKALAAGTATVTATSGSLSDTAQITIYEPVTLPDGSLGLPEGTVRWTVPTSVAGIVENSLNAQVAPDVDTSVFALDTTSSQNVIVRAFASNGRQLWAHATGQRRIDFGFSGYDVWSSYVPTPDGGILYYDHNSLTKLDPQTGRVQWMYAGKIERPVAVGPDGSVYGISHRSLVAIDPTNGNEKWRIPVPADESTLNGQTSYTAGMTSGPLVLADGTIHLTLHVSKFIHTDSPNPHPHTQCPLQEMVECWAVQEPAVEFRDVRETYLVSAKPDSTNQITLLYSTSSGRTVYGSHVFYSAECQGYCLEEWSENVTVAGSGPNGFEMLLVPDGTGGALATFGMNDQLAGSGDLLVRHFPDPWQSPSGPEYRLPLQYANTLVAGENDTAFVAGADDRFKDALIMSFDMNSGARNYTYESNFSGDYNSYLDIVSSDTDRSIVATEGLWQEARVAFRLDPAGTRRDFAATPSERTYVTLSERQSSWYAGSTTASVPWAVINWAGKQLHGSPKPSPARAQDLGWFPELEHCQQDVPGCIGRYEAIYNALDDLISRLRTPSLSALAQTEIFTKVGNDANGFPLTTDSFLRYLTTKRPRFHDGLNSTFCYEVLQGSMPRFFCLPPILGKTVKYEFETEQPAAGALTDTPGDPLLTFFRPQAIGYGGLGRNAGNESLIFHEALHGISGINDGFLLERLGFNALDSSCKVDKKIRLSVLSQSPGLDPEVASPCE